MSASFPSGNAESASSGCSRAEDPGQEDRWYFLTYRADERGVEELQIPFASERTFAETLLGCADLGLFPRDRLGPTQGIPILREELSYIPAIGSHDVQHRLVRLEAAQDSGLTGDLALRIEVNRAGEVLSKELLFATDEQLGQLVLKDLEKGLEIASPGEGPGPFIDILDMKIEKGELVVFGQSHFSRPKG